MQSQGIRYLRVKAVAEMFDVSPSTIYRAIEAGQLDAIRIGGALRVPESAVAAFVEQTVLPPVTAVAPAASGEGLSPAQLAGHACVRCGLDYRTAAGVGVSSVPVATLIEGGQLFACATHPQDQADRVVARIVAGQVTR